MNLEKLDLNPWLKDKLDPAKLHDYRIARVTAVNKDNFILKNEKNEVFAELTGKFLFNVESSLDTPTVGDWVYAQYFDDDSFAVIHELVPRKSILKRKTSGKKIEFQLIAANIDTAFIMQSLDSNYNLRRLERYLAMIHEANIRPVVLLSKSDLVSPEEIEEKLLAMHSTVPDVQVLAFSNLNGSGLDQIHAHLVPGETVCLLGSSGVGKTTLLNKLLGEDLFKTQEVREKDERGKHTTSRRQLITLKNGAMIIDMPGMRELGNIGVESGLQETFSDIVELANKCRFTNCTHLQENGCAVLSAVDDGSISQERYHNYIQMKKESAFNERSYLEKRRRDKKFGRFYKSVQKDNVKTRK
ncbi:ribosome small subunit-dependent GTPase A [candidate division KSB1 bacterium]|nr:ribosome small subunit-dependent GTPase A [candidate division KSB1 bacterium]